MSELKVAGFFNRRIEAEIAQGLLTEQGIESIIAADDCGGQLMGLSTIRKGGIKLMVREEDMQKAENALEVLESEEQSSS